MSTVYEIVTGEIIKRLEAGTIPWAKPWKSAGTPKNFISKKEYRGMNTLLLGMAEYTCPYWVTFKQALDLKGNVRKGEKSSLVVFWKFFDSDGEENGDETKHDAAPMLRYYRVFNLEQCENIPWTMPEGLNNDLENIEACENIVNGFTRKPAISYGGDRAYYRPSTDSIRIPEKTSFIGAEEFYDTLFHELVHSTGHETRLDRKGVTESAGFGSETYSKEELVAEIGASFLCGIANIERKTIDNSAAYIAAWLRKLREDSKLVVIAASQAQKAVDFITIPE